MLNKPLLTGPYSSTSQTQRRFINQFIKKSFNGLYKKVDIKCFCDLTEDILIAQKDRYGIPINTYLCKNCGVMRSTPQLNQQSLTKFYNNEYRKIYSPSKKGIEKHFERQKEHGTHIFNFLKSFAKISKETVVYDIGCGAGGALIPFALKGAKTKGYDISRAYVEYGKINKLNVTYSKTKFFKPERKVDIILLSHVLEHYLNPLQELSRIRSLLDDRGLLYIELPGILSISQEYHKPMFALQQAHIWYFTLSTLTNLLNCAGFRLIKGNEKIQAVFKKSDYKEYISNGLEARKVLASLRMSMTK